ncbi:unnamed protein product [Notodromas monacha]|uniref:Reverse transcriptase/retrotransposon-derived protein RNase H-like domain-containing protein n=1 Tax=Notodromas monacha TaxID=399045 RepID=A0A7R9GJ03_9CRUS|nr:unnamed protein product [Notodromas monacha]CAG0922371.1 unnamed protein product [Notodromas monacha]
MITDRTESEPQPGPSNANALPQPVASLQPRATANPWNFLMLNAIRTYTIANGIPNSNEVPRDKLIIALQARGATPLNIILSSPPDYQTGPGSTELLAQLLLRRHVDYPHQSPNKSIEMYLRRLETAFKHDGTPNFTKVDCLIGHSQPKVAEATQLLYDQGFEDYDVIAEKLKARFGLSPFEHFTRFQQFRPAPDELFSQFSPRLRDKYLRYIPLPANEVGQHETAIMRALIGQLLSITTGGLHAQLHARATADRSLTWDECLVIANKYRRTLPATPKRAATPAPQSPASRPPKTTASGVTKYYCKNHQRGTRYKAALITWGVWLHIQPRNAGTTRPTRTYRSNMSGKREDRGVTAVLCSIPTPTDDSLTIIITIKDKRVTPLIDTGATKLFMAMDVAEEVGLSPHPTKARISVAVLHVSTTVSHAVSTVFTLGSAAYEATFLLLSNAHYPVILGLDTLKNLPFCVTLDGQRVFSGFQQIKPIKEAPKVPIGEGIKFVHGTPTEQQQITALLRRYAPHIFQWSGKHGLFPQHVASLLTNGEDPKPSRCIRLLPNKRPAFQHIIDNYTRAGIIEPAQTGTHPSEEHLKAVQAFPQPATTRQMQRFLGLATYLRAHVPTNFAQLKKVLRLTIPVKPATAIVWSPEAIDAFEALKNLIANAARLERFDPAWDTEIHCDVSASAIGAILVQIDPEGQPHIMEPGVPLTIQDGRSLARGPLRRRTLIGYEKGASGGEKNLGAEATDCGSALGAGAVVWGDANDLHL